MSGARQCPHCGGTGFIATDDDEAVEKIVAELREGCRELNIAVGLSRTITEGDAAHLLGRAPATLRNWRFAGCPIAFQRIGGRVRYTLRDLAAWLLDNRN